MKRRRPRHHKRKVGDTYVDVNSGVEYAEESGGGHEKRKNVSDGVSQVASAPRFPSLYPAPDIVASVKAPKNGIFWKSTAFNNFDPFTTFCCKREMQIVGDYATGTVRSAEGVLPLFFRGERLNVNEGAHLTKFFASNMNYCRSNLRKLTLDPVDVLNCDFSGAMLDEADFSGKGNVERKIRKCLFVGASCRDANFQGVVFDEGNSFVGSDLTGVSFAGSRILGAGNYGALSIHKGSIDFTDSNVTAEQIQQILDGSPECETNFGGFIQYREYTFAEAASIVGVDVEDIATFVWTSGTEVRDNDRKLRADTSYLDAANQHIPQWSMREIVDSFNSP